jgi:uncharacterized membrane protein
MKPSAKYSLNKADIKAQAKSALIFLGPSILAFFVALSPAIESLKADTTTKMILIVIVKYVLDQLTGILRRFLAGK